MTQSEGERRPGVRSRRRGRGATAAGPTAPAEPPARRWSVSPTALLAVLAPLALFALPAASAAQSAALARVDSLTAAGRIEAARSLLMAWWDGDRRAATREDVQRSLWLRARLTVDPTMAATDYRRLVVEYPGGPWTDLALERLAFLADARGDRAGAGALRTQLVRDHPTSSRVAAAEAWLAQHPDAARGTGTERRVAARAGASERDTPPAGARPAEGRRTEDWVQDRAEGPRAGTQRAVPSGPEPGGDPALSAGAPASTATSPSDARGSIAVQLGAFSSEEGARTLAERMVGLGWSPRIVRVPGSPLLRVRVGRFDERAPAEDLRERARASGVDAMVVSDAARELPVS